MKSLLLMVSCCADTGFVTSICWGVLGLVALFFILKFIVQPWMSHCHESKMKEEAHNREKEWADFKKAKASTDEALKDQVKDLKSKLSELEGTLESEKFKNGLLEKQLKMYRDLFDKLNVEVKPKEKK